MIKNINIMRKKYSKKVATLGSIAKSVDDLAVITARGFERVDKRFEAVDKNFASIGQRFESMEQKLDELWLEVGIVRRDVFQIKEDMVHRDEFDDLKARVKFLEGKLRVKV